MKNDFTIDVEKLDLEWALLPQIYSEYSEQAEILDSEVRRKKMQLEMRRANLSKEIRDNSKQYKKEYGLNSITEGFVSNLVDTDEGVRDLEFRIIQLDRERKLLQSSCRSLEMKRDALKNLTSLFQTEYFSMDNIAQRIKEHQEEKEKLEGRDVRLEIKEKLRNKTKTIQQRGEE